MTLNVYLHCWNLHFAVGDVFRECAIGSAKVEDSKESEYKSESGPAVFLSSVTSPPESGTLSITYEAQSCMGK